jgi:hypothetical protein
MTTTPTWPRRRRAQPRAQARDSEPSTERARAEQQVWGWWAHPQARHAPRTATGSVPHDNARRGGSLPPKGGFDFEDVDVGAQGGGAAQIGILDFRVDAEAVGGSAGGGWLNAQRRAGVAQAREVGR